VLFSPFVVLGPLAFDDQGHSLVLHSAARRAIIWKDACFDCGHFLCVIWPDYLLDGRLKPLMGKYCVLVTAGGFCGLLAGN